MRLFFYTFSLVLLVYSCGENRGEIKGNKELSFYLGELKRNNSENNDSLMLVSEELLNRFPQDKAGVSVKLGNLFYAKSKLYLSQYYFKYAADIYKEQEEEELYAEQLTNIGVLNEVTGDYTASIAYYFEALSIFKRLKLELKTSYIYNNLGIVYQQLKEKDKSLMYYKKGLEVVLDLGRKDLSASKYNNIASLFEEFDGELDSALVYYHKAYKAAVLDSNFLTISAIEANIANVYIRMGELEKADSLLSNALLKSELNHNNRTINLINRFKAELLLKKGNYVEADAFAQKTIALAQQESYKEIEIEGMLILIESLVKQGDYEKAFNLLIHKNQLESELAGEKQKERVEQLNIRYDVQEKDNKIQMLELRKKIMVRRGWITAFIVVALFIILSISLYVIYLKNKHSVLLIKQMQRDIADYIHQLHQAEEELQENELSQNELLSLKIKKFNLTEREEEVLILISKGLTNTEIAAEMFVSINTIKTHVKNLFIKLDVRNRIEAANKAKAL
ncbi:MAG: tetratricopeptide repeat protein [Flavobacteriales bacterium]|jgi:DNA-binding CsgD family transcriptional regulator|nr:tetratricopeptide repeat protein [Flavobacteriales bacterium]